MNFKLTTKATFALAQPSDNETTHAKDFTLSVRIKEYSSTKKLNHNESRLVSLPPQLHRHRRHAHERTILGAQNF